MQLEVFFNSIHLKIAGNFEESKEPEIYYRSELALESLVDFCREPSLVLELYTNYDCDVHFANLYEALVKFLCTHAFPLNRKLNRLNELCIEGLNAILKSIAIRCIKRDQEEEEKATDNSFREKKKEKVSLNLSAEMFNSMEKGNLAKLKDHGFIPRNADAATIAKFLFENPAIDKEVLGEFLGSVKPLNVEVLNEFLKLTDYTDMRIDNALKAALSSFRMPGEA